MTNIDTLSGISFLHSNVHKSKSLASFDAKDRIEDLSYIKVGCYLDGTTMDKRISLPGIDLRYCLKLLHSSYDPSTEEITALTTPGTPVKSAPHSPIKKLLFDADDNDESVTDGSTSVSSPDKSVTPPHTVTPKTSHLFRSASSGQTVTSYLGSMSFLDDQEEFDKVFGKKLVILGVNPH